jgi:type VI secretion system protein ImpL
MRNALRWLLSPAVIGTIGLLVLSALVWWAFPLVAFGSVRPFDSFWVRTTILLVLWGLWIGWRGRVFFSSARKASQAPASATASESCVL